MSERLSSCEKISTKVSGLFKVNTHREYIAKVLLLAFAGPSAQAKAWKDSPPAGEHRASIVVLVALVLTQEHRTAWTGAVDVFRRISSTEWSGGGHESCLTSCELASKNCHKRSFKP